MTTQRDHSEQVAAEIDREVRRIVDDAYDTAMTMLEENQDKLHLIAEALLEHETVNGEEFYVLMDEGMDAFNEKMAEFEKKREEDRKKIEARKAAETEKEQAREEAERKAFEALMKARSEAVKEKEAPTAETFTKAEDAPKAEEAADLVEKAVNEEVEKKDDNQK
jgi:cell division protease FtsH